MLVRDMWNMMNSGAALAIGLAAGSASKHCPEVKEVVCKTTEIVYTTGVPGFTVFVVAVLAAGAGFLICTVMDI